MVAKVLTLVFLTLSIVFYRGAFSTIHKNIVTYNSNFKLYDGAVFPLDVNYQGVYTIELSLVDTTNNLCYSFSSTPMLDFLNTTEEKILDSSHKEVASFKALPNSYKFNFSINSKDQFDCEIHVKEITATASKNSYIDREFKPLTEGLFYVFFSLAVPFLLVYLRQVSKRK